MSKVELLTEWEEKVVPVFEEIDLGVRDIIELHRDWLLGGEMAEWAYFRSPTTGDLILRRR